MKIELSKRLQAVADMVTSGVRLADIGTDHGYIPIYLVSNNIVPSALAMDVNKGPLERAQEHIQEYELDSKIQTRLSDGLKKLEPGEVDSIITAGMGGALVIKILSDKPEVTESLKELVLQPQSEISKVREWLCQKGYRIIEEKMILEDEKYYPMMKAVKGDVENYSEIELEFGKRLLEEGNPVLKQFLEREIALQERLFQSLNEKQTERTKERMEQVAERISVVKEVLNQYF